ncbi:MAG: MgtC/SapB family protein [Beijerinckiaceae bacterium]
MTASPEIDLAFRIGTAFAIGLVVGVERGWRERTAEAGSRTAGVRTYALSGLLGGVFGALASSTQSLPLIGFGFIGFSFAFALFKFREAVHDKDFSVTGVIAALTVFALGAYAVVGNVEIAAGAGVAVAGLLAGKDMLHGLVARLSWVELRSVLMILGMSAIVLPLLPDRALDPFNGVNPYEVWLFAILVAAVSFAGYFALKFLPSLHGIAVGAMLGALVSSTAVTLDFARRSRMDGVNAALAGGACLAAAVSVVRVMLIVAIIVPAMVLETGPPALGGALLFAALGAILLAHSSKGEKGAIAPGNPFEPIAVFAFAAIFAVTSLCVALLQHWLGSVGLLAAAAISAVADVDAAVLASLRLADKTTPSAVGTAILLALAVNGLTKCAYAGALGSARFAGLYCGTSALALAVACAIYILMNA